jgi:hypothetical protein
VKSILKSAPEKESWRAMILIFFAKKIKIIALCPTLAARK